jgi:hypothetical protein
MDGQHRRGALAHGLSSERCHPAGLDINPIGGEAAGRGTGSEKETAVWIEPKCAGDGFGRHMTGRCQMPSSGIDRESRDAVVAAIPDIEETPRWGQVDLRTGVTGGRNPAVAL